MTTAPALDPAEPRGFLERRYALLINPFYPKDANASFGKHVLTPTLALTSFAATTPAHWRVEYWDENLLDGRPPFQPATAGRRHHRASHLRAAGVRTGGLVPRPRIEGNLRRPARSLVSRRMRAPCRRPRARRRRATLAAHPARRRSEHLAAALRRHLRKRLLRRSRRRAARFFPAAAFSPPPA